LTTISNILIHYREYHKITQNQLAEKLALYSMDFINLNSVTISRWETGTTAPSMNKKKKLLHFFMLSNCMYENQKCYTILQDAYKKLYEPLSKVFIRNYQYLIGNFPEFKLTPSNLYSLMDFNNKNEHIEHIIDIEVITNIDNYYTVTNKNLENLCNHPSSFSIICERKKQHLGHFIMFKIKNSVAEEIVRYKRKEHTITVNDICTIEERGTYYIHAFYGKNPKIAALLNTYAYLHLFNNIKTIDNLLIFSSRKDGVLLTKDYGIELIDKGFDEELNFQWHGLMSPIEDILFSDTVIKCIF